jgi:hypothetical protein
MMTSSNPVDMGWVAARTHHHCLFVFVVVGNFRLGSTGLGREVMVKVYGVAMTMPQG